MKYFQLKVLKVHKFSETGGLVFYGTVIDSSDLEECEFKYKDKLIALCNRSLDEKGLTVSDIRMGVKCIDILTMTKDWEWVPFEDSQWEWIMGQYGKFHSPFIEEGLDQFIFDMEKGALSTPGAD